MATLAPRDPITQSINLAQYEAYSGENICGTPGLVNYTLTAGDSKEASYSMNVVSSSATGLYDFDRITTGLKNGFSFNNQDNAALTSFNFVNFCDVGSDGYNTLLREVTNVDKGGYDSMRVYSTSIQYGPQNMSVNKIIIIEPCSKSLQSKQILIHWVKQQWNQCWEVPLSWGSQ